MIAFFLGVVLLDGWLDGSLLASTPDKSLQGTLFCILIALLMIPAQLELAQLASAKGLNVLTPISTLASIVLATSWYWAQLIDLSMSHLALAIVFSLLAMFQYQHLKYGTSGTLGNCGASCLSVCYLGLLGAFALAIRVRFGVWPLLMYVFTVKCSDIGAYSIGKLCGRHKFSPRISPGKTWEGMGGAAAAAAITAMLFGRLCGIMSVSLAFAFGVCFAFVGQMGDLVESMLKRDAEQKDSASKVPGFGGVLDILDSPLAAAPFAYLFFVCCL
jgi:phosphatidate cytidylyltransferase